MAVASPEVSTLPREIGKPRRVIFSAYCPLSFDELLVRNKYSQPCCVQDLDEL